MKKNSLYKILKSNARCSCKGYHLGLHLNSYSINCLDKYSTTKKKMKKKKGYATMPAYHTQCQHIKAYIFSYLITCNIQYDISMLNIILNSTYFKQFKKEYSIIASNYMLFQVFHAMSYYILSFHIFLLSLQLF